MWREGKVGGSRRISRLALEVDKERGSSVTAVIGVNTKVCMIRCVGLVFGDQDNSGVSVSMVVCYR